LVGICDLEHDCRWEKSEYFPGLEDFQKLLQLFGSHVAVRDLCGTVENQVHQVVDVRAECVDVAALHMLQDAVHVVQVFNVVFGRLLFKLVRLTFVM
jgi:hypothetical protein